LPGIHDPIIDQATFDQAEQIRGLVSITKGGQQPISPHLLVNGILRCRCGYAMLPRSAKTEHDRYVCRGRIDHGREFCDQPSLQRDVVDAAFLEHLLDHYIDFEATKRRITDQTESDLLLAREAFAQTDAEVSRVEAALKRIECDYVAGKITAEHWARFEPKLTDEFEAASQAAQRASAHVERLEKQGPLTNAEAELFEYLTELRDTVRGGVEAAPDLSALRRVIAQLFERIDLGSHSYCATDGDGIPSEYPLTKDGVYLYPRLRQSALDPKTFEPVAQEIPIPEQLRTHSPGRVATVPRNGPGRDIHPDRRVTSRRLDPPRARSADLRRDPLCGGRDAARDL
jgi:hypothetical protein